MKKRVLGAAAGLGVALLATASVASASMRTDMSSAPAGGTGPTMSAPQLLGSSSTGSTVTPDVANCQCAMPSAQRWDAVHGGVHNQQWRLHRYVPEYRWQCDRSPQLS